MSTGLLSLGYQAVGSLGFSQVGTGLGDAAGSLLNTINTGNQLTFTSTDPSFLDANGYPATTLTAGQQITFNIAMVDSQTGPSTQWVFKWTPAGNAVWFLNGGWSNIVATGCTATSNTFNTTVTCTAGTPARVIFNWSQLPGSNLQTIFKAATYAPGSPPMVLCRASDESAIDAGQIFTPEYLALWQGLNLRTIRTMTWTNTGSSNDCTQSLWKYRTTISRLGWRNFGWPPGAWGGTISGTNQYTSALPTDSSPSGWTDGEVIQGAVTNASTTANLSVSGAVNNGSGLIRLTVSSTAALTTGQQVYVTNLIGTWEANGVQTVTVIDITHIDLQGTTFVNAYGSGGGVTTLSLTVTGKTNGTAFILSTNGNTKAVAAGNTTFVYNAILGALVDGTPFGEAGISANLPIEAHVALANTLNVNLWTIFPVFANNSYCISQATLIRDTLKPLLKWYPEYSNETWNPSFPQFTYCVNAGLVLGGISKHGFHSLRTRQIMEAITSTWTATRSQSSLARVMAWQAAGDNTTTSQRLNSSELNSASNAKLLAYAGSVNYTTAGQRAIDWCDVGSYAVYTSGALLTNGAAQGDASAIAQIQTLATAFNSNASDPTSLSTLDNDFRQGTIKNNTISSVSGTTINATAHGFSNGNRGVFTNTGGSLYTGVSLNTPYYVVGVTTNTFGVSLTNGGSAISLSGGSGTTSFGRLGGQTLLDFSQTVFQNVGGNTVSNPGWEQVAATYDTYRNSVSQPLLSIECYEGALEAIAPTTAQCTTMGVLVGGSAATASTALAAGLTAYKNTLAAKSFALAQFQQFKGQDATQPLTFGLMVHSKTPSWFVMVGLSQWSLLSGGVGSTPFQTYNGVAAFNG